jgi:serine/threonine protein kinase
MAEPGIERTGANNYAPLPVAPAPAPAPAPATDLLTQMSGKISSFSPESGRIMIGTPSAFRLPDGKTFGEHIAENDWIGAEIGQGVSGKTYKVKVGEDFFVLKHITNVARVPVKTIVREIEFLNLVRGKWWAVQLLAAQFMPDKTAFLLFPYIPGRDMIDVINDRSVSQDRLGTIYETILTALLELHDMGIIHRDIKPDNVFVPNDASIRPFLLDFGLSGRKTEIMPTAGTRAYYREERRGLVRNPTPNDNFYALGKSAEFWPTFRPTALKLLEEGLTNETVRANRAYHFEGGKRTRRRRQGRKQRAKTRKY